MIIRIIGEGQWQIDEDQIPDLNVLDKDVTDALEQSDQDKLTKTLKILLAAVKEKGSVVPDDVLAESDLILPEADITLEEMQEWLDATESDEGLIPGV